MTLQAMIDECAERLEHYDENPTAPRASIYVYAYANRLDALLQLQHTQQKQNFYSNDY